MRRVTSCVGLIFGLGIATSALADYTPTIDGAIIEWAPFPYVADPHDTGAPHDIRKTWVADDNTSGSNGYLYFAYEFHNKIGDITAGSHLDSLHLSIDTNFDGTIDFQVEIDRNVGTFEMTRNADGTVFSYAYGVDYRDVGQRGLEFRIPYAHLGLVTGSDRFIFSSSADPGGDRQPDSGTLMYNGPAANSPTTVLAPTSAAIGAIRVASTRAGVEVSWQTGAELDNAGFHVYRLTRRAGWVRVGSLAGRGTTPLGGTYAVVDPDGRAGDLYAVGDVSFAGVETFHLAGLAVPEALLPAKRRIGDAFRAREIGRQSHPALLPPGRPVAIGSDVKIAVTQGGLVRVPRASLLAAGATASSPAPRLSFMGMPVPAWWATSGDLLFYAPRPDSPVRDEDVYVLHASGPGYAPSRAVRAPSRPELAGAPRVFGEVLVVEEEGVYNPAAPDEDPFTMAYVTTDMPRAVPVAMPGVTAGALVDVTVRLRGTWDDLSLAPDHHAIVEVAGVAVGEVWFDGTEAAEAVVSIPADLLAADGAVTIVAPGDSGIPWEAFEVDEIELAYPRSRALLGGRLTVAASSSEVVRVTGAGAAAVVLDVTDERSPVRLLGGATVAGEVRFVEKPGAFARPTPRRYHVAEAGGEVAPAWVAPLAALEPVGAADYVIVTHDDLSGAAASLAAYRAGTGFVTRVVDVDEVYDAYAGGNRGPDALVAFLGELAASGVPRHVVLLGAASVDPRNHLGTSGPDHVPSAPVRERSRGIQAWSDELYVAGGNIALGRIPARSAAEAQAYVDKVIAFEAQLATEGVAGRALLVADATAGGDLAFDLALDETAALIAPTTTSSRVSVGTAGAATARAQLLAELAAPADFVVFAGHGNPLWWSRQQILTLDDAPSLSGSRPAVFLSASCYDAYFTHPEHAPLGWALVTGPTDAQAGAIATIASTTLANPGVVAAFDELILREIVVGGATTWGDAYRRARKTMLDADAAVSDVLATVVFLGDPALPAPAMATESDY